MVFNKLPSPGSFLIVSGSEKNASTLIALLRPDMYSDITVAHSGSEARRTLISGSYDTVIINTPLPDEFGHELAMSLSDGTNSFIILIIKNDLYDEVSHRVDGFGIITLPRPVSRQQFYQAIQFISAMRAKWRMFEREKQTLQSKLEEIRLVSRAKCILIQNLRMSESTAHRHIEKQAMDMRTTRREIAENIIKTYEN